MQGSYADLGKDLTAMDPNLYNTRLKYLNLT